MVQPVEFRIPGVYFLPQPPSNGLALPRLDVAAFVGFAERGPIDLPVPIEDFRAYRQVFGGDLPLAQETAPPAQAAPASPAAAAELGATPNGVVFANLPGAVQAFFANGGRHCYVVRVAGDQAQAARFRLPGVVSLGAAARGKLAGVSASSPGAWGNRLRLATRLAVTQLPAGLVLPVENAGSGLTLRVDAHRLHLGASNPIQAGDVLRLRFEDGTTLLSVVGRVGEDTLHLSGARRLETGLPAQATGAVSRLSIDGSELIQAAGTLKPDAEASAAAGRMVLTLRGDPEQLPAAGEILHIDLLDGSAGCLAAVAGRRAVRAAGAAVVAGAVEVILAGFLRLEEVGRLPSLATGPAVPAGILTVELLRLEVLVRLGERRYPAITDLAFNAGSHPAGRAHPRFWGDAIWPASAFSAAAGSSAGPAPRTAGHLRAETSGFSAAAELFRSLFADPYHACPACEAGASAAYPQEDLLPEEPRFWDPGRHGFNPLAAFAGLLAPAGSGLSLTYHDAIAQPQLANGRGELDELFLPLGLPEIFTEAGVGQFRAPEPNHTGDDDLGTFRPELFYDPRLAPEGAPGRTGLGEKHTTLLATASALRYIQGQRLRRMHSLMFVAEAALISIPDAAHQPWEPAPQAAAPPPPKPAPAGAAPDCPPASDFQTCSQAPIVREVTPHWGAQDEETRVEISGQGFTTGADTQLFFGMRPASDVQVISSTRLAAMAPRGLRLGPVDVNVTTQFGRGSFLGGFTYTAPGGTARQALPRTIPVGINDLPAADPILPIHQALADMCQARGDLVAILSLPKVYGLERCLEWQSELRKLLHLPDLSRGSFSSAAEPVETADLSYLAVYHPWLKVFDPSVTENTAVGSAAGLRPAPAIREAPADGAVCGLIAARERERGVWVAPTNRPLTGVLGLKQHFTDEDWSRLYARGFNLIRAEAANFAPMSAHTLSGARSLLQISVRRLMILLKKAAIDLGMDFAFETNHAVFREGVRAIIEQFLSDLYDRGAFAGNSRDGAYRVITGDSVNPPESVEAGRFVVLIQVAPAQPMEFITVQLIRLSEGGLSAGEA